MDHPALDKISPRKLARSAKLIATVFGVGFAHPAPGTVASLVALPIAWAITWGAGRFVLLIAAILAGAAGAWACELYVRNKQDKDPSECVIDEVAGQWLACAFVPVTFGIFSRHTIVGYAIAFVLFRLLDITKPWPIGYVERRLPGGLGVMMDDIVAGLISGIFVIVIAYFGLL